MFNESGDLQLAFLLRLMLQAAAGDGEFGLEFGGFWTAGPVPEAREWLWASGDEP